MEHDLQEYEISSTHIEHYNLGPTHCREFCKHGGVGISLHETLSFSTTDLSKFCNEQDLEICAVQLNILSSVLCILCIYRPPTGNFLYFLKSLELILNQSFTNSLNLIICGDININYLVNTSNKLQLDSLLASYNLCSVVDFATKISKYSPTIIDNIFIDQSKNMKFTIKPPLNGLSDHDAQILILHNLKIQNPKHQYSMRRLIDETTTAQFKINLSYESWSDIFNESDVDTIFNSFLNTYLRIFYHSFPQKTFTTTKIIKHG